MDELAKAYEPAEIEERWSREWIDAKVFAVTDDESDARPKYVLPMPPPNVTGSLHMGHALTCTLEDALTRYHRMNGHEALWQPGIDHAGIATQTVVERQLKRDGKSRHDLSREAFIDRVWQWKGESGGRIALQQRTMGVSADWDRTAFTMDPGYSVAVREAFVRLFEEGLIYRDTRLVHWDCEARTVLSNLEVENEKANGELFEFAYVVEGTDTAPSTAPQGVEEISTAPQGVEEIVVATTRPETMLGDTAVAIHPDDPRFAHLHGKFVTHPFLDRRIPIILDAELVDMAFGTGAVKITPAHDFNDFATGKRHKLPEINVMNPDGTMNEICGPFAGMDRFVARKAVKKALDEKGLSRGSKPHELMLPRSERNGSVVEPMISTQWFVRMKPLAEPALAAVRNGETVIIPASWQSTYEHWLTEILDWCISRQLWWGHRVPAFHCKACGHIMVTREDPTKCSACDSTDLEQDPDVLDTWFSSGLWPMATMGWPQDTPAFRKFYPASDLETGYDILFFWVARMMMMGIHFTGKAPFSRVLLHGLVVDETGEKMSKVKGNVIDPLDLVHGATFASVVEKALPGAPPEEALKKFKKAYPSAAALGQAFPAFGADALRFALATYSPQAHRIPLSIKKIESARHFLNKIWNATRFALSWLDGAEVKAAPPRATLLANRWILSRLGAAIEACHTGTRDFRLDDASGAMWKFFWNDLCDWFLELAKPVFVNDAGADTARETRDVLAYVLEASLRLMHPIIPFITEELWHKVPRPENAPRSIAMSKYPDAATAPRDAEAEADMATLQAVIGSARSIRSEHEVHPGATVKVELRTANEAHRALLQREQRSLRVLVKTDGEPVIAASGGARPAGYVMHAAADVEVLVSLVGLVDPDKEAARVEREIGKADKDIAALEKKLALPSFADKAPPEVVVESKEMLAATKRRRAALVDARGIASELRAANPKKE